MPFRCRQKLENYAAGVILYDVGTPNPDTGLVEVKSVAQNGNDAKLPDSDMMDLQTMIKAGVKLEEVNCKLINPDSNDVSKALSKSMKSTNSNTSDSSEVKADEE